MKMEQELARSKPGRQEPQTRKPPGGGDDLDGPCIKLQPGRRWTLKIRKT